MAATPAPDPENARDRKAVEHIMGRPLNQNWPTDALARGSRVTVIRDPTWDGPWQIEFRGTIDTMSAPEPVRHPHARSGEMAYWVRFDAQQYDSSGDGPYRKALIWDRYLKPEVDPEG